MKLYSDRYKTGQKALTREEYNKLISCITDIQDELMIRFAVDTGLRREDLCNVECDQIDLKNNKLRFHEAKKDHTDKKTNAFTEKWRTIDLSNEVVALIQKFYNTLDKSELRKRQYLFDYVGRTAYRHFNRWCVVAGIDERPIHALRATCIKFAHEAEWSDMEIADLTGDKISTIQEHYMTPSVDEMRQAKQKKAFI